MLNLTTKADLQRLIDEQIREDLHLEFKAGEAIGTRDRERNEMSKDVSPMANADGGQIIYGIAQDENGLAVGFSPVDGARHSPESIEQMLRSRVSPPIKELRIHIGRHPQISHSRYAATG
ncbi:putative HTH transcriptional regulator [Bosea sp. BE125]|uniref:AlbA family DNA-binding domain-containing protein n=1 Tax=Bosea sp. BE125 TaxID=2817909 RepID=UPI002859156C|nr:ATP-binding protein [Bosea sp. BE125]MDR6872174.1 putative HTH transcriptional regulator [Bosea sp. BE125]